MGLSYIEDLSKYGAIDDQMANQFELYFFGKPVSNIQEIALRMDKSFDIPEKSVSKVDINYQGVKIPKLLSQEETDKSFNLTFRLDENWMVYNTLNIWFGRTLHPKKGSTLPIKDREVTALFRALKKNKEVSREFVFRHVLISSIKLLEFDHSSSEPTRVDCKFIYSYVDDPINDLFI